AGAQGLTVSGHGRGDRSRSRATPAQSGRIPTHESGRRRRLSLPAARAAPPASSRPFPPPGPSQRSPSSSTSLCAVGHHLPGSFAHERNIAAKLDGPMTFGYGVDAIDAARKNQRGGTNICFSRRKGALVAGRVPTPAAGVA